MSITVVTRYSGDVDVMLKVAKINGPLFVKYGATSVSIKRIRTGTHVTDLLAVFVYPNMAAWESTRAAIMKNAAYQKAVAMLSKAAKAEETTVLEDIAI